MKEDNETNVEQILHLFRCRAESIFLFIFTRGFGVKELVIALSAGRHAIIIAPDTRIIIIYTVNNTEGIYFLFLTVVAGNSQSNRAVRKRKQTPDLNGRMCETPPFR